MAKTSKEKGTSTARQRAVAASTRNKKKKGGIKEYFKGVKDVYKRQLRRKFPENVRFRRFYRIVRNCCRKLDQKTSFL